MTQWARGLVLVVGGARSGIAAARFLHTHGFAVVLTDRAEMKEKAALQAEGIEVYDGGHPDHLIRKYEFVVKNPGIPLTHPLIRSLMESGNEVINEIELAYRYVKNFCYGAITGTNGKTTTTSLLHAFLKGQDERALLAGNIGVPLCDLAMHYGSDCSEDKIPVALELSSFQLQTMPSFAPDVSVILNLTPDHLDYHASLDEYYRAKTNIYRNMPKDGYFLRNRDDALVMEYVRDVPCTTLDYSLKQWEGRASIPVDIYRWDHGIYFRDVLLFDEREMLLVGEHNVQNAMVASTMAYLMGVKPEVIRQVLASFSGVEHRLEFVREYHGVKYYNDSKGTNVDAAKIALASFPKDVIWLAGGKDKKTGYELLWPYLNRVKMLIAYGEAREGLAQLMIDYCQKHQLDPADKLKVVHNLNEAVTLAHKQAETGDIVLLSPACSSFDQFQNFEERGKVFKELVQNLK